jgi:GAF domain-containing protein
MAEVDAGSLSAEAVVRELLAAVGTEATVAELARACAGLLVERLGLASARIWMVDDTGVVLEQRASAGVIADETYRRIAVGAFSIGTIARLRRPHITNDVAHDPGISDPLWARRNSMVAFAGYPLVADDELVGVLAVFSRQALPAADLDVLERVAEVFAAEVARARALETLRAEHAGLAYLERLSEQLTASQFDVDRMVQLITDTATELSGAAFGSFFYNVTGRDGESFLLYSLTGGKAEDFGDIGLPRNTPIFEPTFHGTGVVRLDDVTADPRYGQMAPHHGMPHGHLPVRSYLAVPVFARGGEVLGGLFFGHPEVGVFTEAAQAAVEAVARHAGLAIENARLYQHEHNVALTLQQSLLPQRLPALAGVRLAAQYRPGSRLNKVGGDWYDAVVLPDGRLGVAVGDVVGHDIQAAATMGQLRGAMRAYMLAGGSAGSVLAQLDRYIVHAELDTFTTAICAVYDPATGMLEMVRAGHVPPVLRHPDGTATVVDSPSTRPLGAGMLDADVAASGTVTVAMPPGSTLLLYTDGLVESRTRGVQDGIDQLLAVVADAPHGQPMAMCRRVLQRMAADGDDDVAVLAVATTDPET